MVGFRGSLELSSRGSLGFGSVLVTEREREALLSRSTWYEMTLMEEEHRYLDQSSTTEVVGASNSQGASTIADNMTDPSGGSF